MVVFMNLPEEYRTDDAQFVVFPVSYEKDVTFGGGASKGAHEIIKASEHLEYYDDEFDCEPFEKGIRIAHEKTYTSPEGMVKGVTEHVAKEITKEHFMVGLGGDHAVTIGLVRGLEKIHEENFSLLVIDAHADFKYSWNNSRLNHACVNRELIDKHSIGVLGVRSLDVDEKEDMQNKNIMCVSAQEYSKKELQKVLDTLAENVYVSIDVDGFDPSFIRCTGTPEPGGFFWKEVMEILTETFKQKNVIGADIVEFAPSDNANDVRTESFALAKLSYKLMALKHNH